jgi:flagellar motor switch protein FliM
MAKKWTDSEFNVLSQEEIDELVKDPSWKKQYRAYLKRTGKKVDTQKFGSGEVLLQEELDQLLEAISSATPEDFIPIDRTRKIKIYDFKRPDKFSKDQIRLICMMYETFGRLCTTMLSAQLRMPVHVHVASVDQLTYEEFVRSIPTPTTLGIVNMDPLDGNAIIEIDPAITSAMIDRFAGGEGDYTAKNYHNQHEITDIESSIMEGVFVRMLGNMRESWVNVTDLRPRLGQIDTNPQFAQIVPPTDMIVLITMECKLGDVEGMINICLPFITIEPIIGKLSLQYWFSGKRRGKDHIPARLLEDVNVPVVARLHETSMTLRELMKLLQERGTIPINSKSIGKVLVDGTVVSYYTEGDKPSHRKQIALYSVNQIMEKTMSEKGNVQKTVGNLADVRLQVITELGRTTKTLSEISDFGEGTIIELDKMAGEPVDVFANNVLVAKGEVVVIDENYGIRLTDIIGWNEEDRTTIVE